MNNNALLASASLASRNGAVVHWVASELETLGHEKERIDDAKKAVNQAVQMHPLQKITKGMLHKRLEEVQQINNSKISTIMARLNPKTQDRSRKDLLHHSFGSPSLRCARGL